MFWTRTLSKKVGKKYPTLKRDLKSLQEAKMHLCVCCFLFGVGVFCVWGFHLRNVGPKEGLSNRETSAEEVLYSSPPTRGKFPKFSVNG